MTSSLKASPWTITEQQEKVSQDGEKEFTRKENSRQSSEYWHSTAWLRSKGLSDRTSNSSNNRKKEGKRRTRRSQCTNLEYRKELHGPSLSRPGLGYGWERIFAGEKKGQKACDHLKYTNASLLGTCAQNTYPEGEGNRKKEIQVKYPAGNRTRTIQNVQNKGISEV